MNNRDLYNDYNDLDIADSSYAEADFDEETLREQLFFTKDEYEQCTRDMNVAKEYVYETDQINRKTYNDIDKMRELVDKNDHKLLEILDQKEALLDQIQRENSEFIDNLDYEYKTKSKQYEEKIDKLIERKSDMAMDIVENDVRKLKEKAGIA